MLDRVYVDYNATTPLHPEAQKALFGGVPQFGNPSSLHQEGQAAKASLEQSRSVVSSWIGAKPDQCVFVGSGSEANNMVIKGVVWPRVIAKEPAHLVVSSIEHPCVIETCHFLQKIGVDVTFLPVDSSGRVSVEDLRLSIRTDTCLVSVMMANNETGVCQPIQALVEEAHRQGVLFHTDAVQVLGKQGVDVQSLGVDFASFSAHKCYAPKGVGVCYVRDAKSCMSLVHGGPQEYRLRAGTESVSAISTFAAVIPFLRGEEAAFSERMAIYRQRFWDGLMAELDGLVLNTSLEYSLANTINISFLGIEAEALAIRLDLEGVALSTGSACSTGSTDLSYVLTAMGKSEEEIVSALRFSFGMMTTEEEVPRLVDIVVRVVRELREKA